MASDKIIIFPLDLNAMLRACVPGGSSCDPQMVADNIRSWFDSNLRSGDPEWIDVRVAEALRRHLKPGQKVIWRTGMRWRDDSGILQNHYEQASVESLAADFGYEIIVNAGCAAIIRDTKNSAVPHDPSKEGKARLFAKGPEAIRDAAETKRPAPEPNGEVAVDAELSRALCRVFPYDKSALLKVHAEVLPLVNRLAERLTLMDKHAAIDNQVIQMLIASGHITNDIATQAFKIAHGFEDGELPPAQAAAGVPADWVAFARLCVDCQGLMVEGNDLSRKAKILLDVAAAAQIPEGDRPGHREALAIQMLVAAGFVTAAKADEALQIASGLVAGPLKPAVNRSWWKDVKPETDLAEANDVISWMLEDWQKVGEALGFKDFADPESIIGVCTGLFEGAPMDAAEALVLLDAVIAKLDQDDEYGLESDLCEARRILSSGATRAKVEPPPSDDFADIREFRRRAAEMDRQDAERAAAEHETPVPAQRRRSGGPHISGGLQPFPFDGIPMDGSVPVYGGDPEFDALPLGAESIPETPKPLPSFQHESPWVAKSVSGRFDPKPEPEWKRDDEKTMLRILLLSAETTGFHGNDPAVHLARIATWTVGECKAVDEWCTAMHHQAADSGVSVPPKPKVLVPERPAAADSDALTLIAKARGPISAEELERAVVSIIVAETRYPEHHFSHAAKRIAELLTRESAE